MAVGSRRPGRSAAVLILKGRTHEMYGRILLPLNGSEVAEAVELDFGLAFVGNVGSGEVKDFTAIGDVVNTAARLRSAEMPGR